jgi:MFS transporter, CP family, cyanate transporter
VSRGLRLSAPWLVVLAGGVAAMQVGKLPPALPALQDELGLSLVQAGFLLSIVQLSGLSLAVFMGLWADVVGLKRTMLRGLGLLALASAGGGMATSVTALLVLRAIEGLGFLCVALPAPALIRRLVPPEKLSGMLGVWGAYMPMGTALALLLGPVFIPALGWAAWWWWFALLAAAMAVALAYGVPDDPPPLSASTLPQGPAVNAASGGPSAQSQEAFGAMPSVGARLGRTLRAPGPWLVALTFAMYSGQWLAVVGFLPSIYAAAGLSGALLGLLSAMAAAVNVLGNMAAGRCLQRGWAPQTTLWLGFAAMALGSTWAFAPFTPEWPWVRYAGVLVFSGFGGLVPGTLFSLAVRLAPGEQQVATTVGWVQQLSALGQFAGPPAVAAVAAHAGGWHFTPGVTVTCCVWGAVFAGLASRLSAQAQSRP